MNEPNWISWGLGAGGITTILIAIINKFRNREEYGADAAKMTKLIADAMQGALATVTGHYQDVIISMSEENKRLEKRMTTLEERVSALVTEVEEYKYITQQTHQCQLLRENREYECPVVSAIKERNNKIKNNKLIFDYEQ